MKALVLSNGRLIEKEIDNTLKALQNEVDGYIEMPFVCKELSENKIHIVINEEGRLKELRPEIILVNKSGTVSDSIYGNCLFVSSEGEDITGLNDKQIDVIKKLLMNEGMIKSKTENISVKVIYV